MQAVISNEYDIGLQETTDGFFRAYCLFKKLFIYLSLQVLSLGIHTGSQLWQVESVNSSSDQGWNLSSLHWYWEVLATGSPGKSLIVFK